MPRDAIRRSPLACSLRALALLAAGCGGATARPARARESAPTIAPATLAAFVAIDTDIDSDQWQQRAGRCSTASPAATGSSRSSRRRSPTRASTSSATSTPRSARDVDFVVLDLGDESDVVGLTQPDDRAEARGAARRRATSELVGRGDRRLDGVRRQRRPRSTRFETRRGEGTLADDEAVPDAMGELPDEALAKRLRRRRRARGAAARASSAARRRSHRRRKSVCVALARRRRRGRRRQLQLGEGRRRHEPRRRRRRARSSDVPSDALVVARVRRVSARALDADPRRPPRRSAQQRSAQFEQLLGVSLDDAPRLLRRRGGRSTSARAPPIPEVTLVVEADDEAQATRRRSTSCCARAGLGRPDTHDPDRRRRGDGGRRSARCRSTPPSYDDRSSSRPRSRDRRLASDGDRSSSTTTASRTRRRGRHAGDDDDGFVYVDIEDALPLLAARRAARRPAASARRAREPRAARVVVVSTARQGRARGSRFVAGLRTSSRARASLGAMAARDFLFTLRVGHRGPPGQDRRPDLGRRPRRRPRATTRTAASPARR